MGYLKKNFGKKKKKKFRGQRGGNEEITRGRLMG